MADSLSKEKRSWLMSRIKGVNTKPETLVRKFLFSKGFRYRLHRSDLPGKPDLILPKYNAIVFVHGCFWHQHTNCKISHQPKTNTSYWSVKLKKNVKRDQKVRKELIISGWRVFVIWECELKNNGEKVLEKLSKKIVSG